jgi:polyisoprenoid-binding protein YceI
MLRSVSALILTGSLLVSAHALAAPETYKVDPAHSFVTFGISHLGYSTLQGRFNELSGDFVYDAERPADNAISMQVNTASIDTNHAERDKHLRSDDFLAVDEYPTATFKTTRFVPQGDNGELSGELTLRGVTRPVTVDVRFTGAGKDPWGGYRRGYAGTTTIKRSDFGIDENLGPAAATMTLNFVVEGVRQ